MNKIEKIYEVMLEVDALVKFSRLDGHEKMKNTRRGLFGIFNVALALRETHYVNIPRVYANMVFIGLEKLVSTLERVILALNSLQRNALVSVAG